MDKGAHFYRCDLQVHSPRDHAWSGAVPIEMEERDAYAGSLIAACREKGVQAIAITDHHDFAFVSSIRRAASEERRLDGSSTPPRDRIIVFPGLELTLGVPCQALLLLDADFPEEWFDLVLTTLAIAPHPPGEAKGPHVERLSFESLMELTKALDKQSVLRGRYILLPNVSESGGSTLLRRGMAPKYAAMPCLGGYVDGPATNLGEGNREILSGRNLEWGNKPVAVFQTSDSRREDHSTLGVPSTWVKWAVPTAEALRQACLARQSRIALEAPQLPSTFIQSLAVSNSKFLGPFVVEFNSQYSAFIGGRGTGKSTVLEYLRWALCDQPVKADDEGELPDFQLRRKSLIEKTLHPFESTVEVRFVVNGVGHVVRRNSVDGKVLLKIADGDLEPTTEAEIRNLVSIQAYSQKQLSSVGVRIDELTRFLEAPGREDLRAIEQDMERLAARIREAHAERLDFRLIRRRLAEEERQLYSLREQAESMRRGLTGLDEAQQAVLRQYSVYQEADQVVEAMLHDVENALQVITGAEQRLRSLPRTRIVGEKRPAWAIVKRLHGQVAALLGDVRSDTSALRDRLQAATEEGGSLVEPIQQWRTEYSAFRRRYDQAKAASESHESKVEQLTAVDRHISEIAASVNQETGQLEALANPEERYEALWAEWKNLHLRQLSVLNGLAEHLAALADDLIRVKLRVVGKGVMLAERLRDLMRGSGIHSARIEDVVEGVVKSDDPIGEWLNLVRDLEKVALWSTASGDDAPLPTSLGRAGISARQIEKLAERTSSDNWLDFALRPVHPVPEFEFEAREGDFIPFVDSSAGQQATALLMALLNQDGPPLIIDQPEDDLDNQVILEIVESIWKAKARRQLIFASHNANLVVNGDAELIVSFDYRVAGDTSGGKISSEGAIDIPETNAVIKRVMEGGEEAFKLRKAKYGF